MLDTQSKRSSALGVALPFVVSLVIPDGTVADGDRQHNDFCYSGVAASTEFEPSPATETPQVIWKSFATPGNSTYHELFGSDGSNFENQVQAVCAADGTLSNWIITMTTAPGPGNARRYTLRVNGADTAVTVYIEIGRASCRERV